MSHGIDNMSIVLFVGVEDFLKISTYASREERCQAQTEDQKIIYY